MKCPLCEKGKIYVYVPIWFRYDVTEDGEIIETSRLSDRAEPTLDEAQCNECAMTFDIKEGFNLIK